MYRSFSKTDRTHLVNALAGDLKTVENQEIRTVFTSFLYKADMEYGNRVANMVNINIKEVKRLANSYSE